jgi:hypothetical protein
MNEIRRIRLLSVIGAVLAAYAVFLVWNGTRHGLPAITLLGVGFAFAAAAVFLRKPRSKWLLLALCLLYMAVGLESILTFYENAGRCLAPIRLFAAIFPSLLQLLIAVIILLLAFRTFGQRGS